MMTARRAGGKAGKGECDIVHFFQHRHHHHHGRQAIITIITCDGGSEENPEDDEYPSVGAKAVLAVCFEPNRTEKFGMEVKVS